MIILWLFTNKKLMVIEENEQFFQGKVSLPTPQAPGMSWIYSLGDRTVLPSSNDRGWWLEAANEASNVMND